MPKYTVTLQEKVVYYVEVEAPDTEAAENMAEEIWCASEDPFGDFRGYGLGVDPINVEELTDG